MRHGSLFSGIGAPELAAEWMEWENVFHCEKEPFPQQILKYYWPNATSYGDIKKTDFSIYKGTIDVLTGGFPCQPYSQAGKRLGNEDDRHLWPEMLRAIREISPRWIVGENVRGITNWNEGVVFDEVQSDMEIEGYEVLPFLLPACAVNAPHRRDRVWFIAHAGNYGLHGSKNRQSNSKRNDNNPTGQGSIIKFKGCSSETTRKTIANTERQGLQKPQPCEQQQPLFDAERNDSPDVTSTNGFRLRGQSNRFGIPGFISKDGEANHWQNFPTQSPVCGGDDGFSSGLDGITFPKWRNESIKAYGNSMVPQVMFQIFKAIKEYEQL